MKTNAILLLAGCALLPACSTISFTNGPVDANVSLGSESNWHHNMWFSLYEASDPVDLKQRCVGRDWVRITTHKSFFNGLAGGIDSAVLGLRVGGVIVGIDIWDPWTVAYECK